MTPLAVGLALAGAVFGVVADRFAVRWPEHDEEHPALLADPAVERAFNDDRDKSCTNGPSCASLFVRDGDIRGPPKTDVAAGSNILTLAAGLRIDSDQIGTQGNLRG